MPKGASSRINVGEWETSSSSEEDWGDGEWKVLRIAKDHVHTRGDLRFNIEWATWQRDDGSNSTWEKQDGTTMRDLAGLLRRWQRIQDIDFIQEAESPTVPPFMPSACYEDENAENAGKRKKANSKAFRYTFTELAHQEHQMGIHRKDEDKFSETSSLVSAGMRLQSLRNTRESALQALDSTISDAPSLCLYDLGPVPQKKARYQVQKKRSLHNQMRSLGVSDTSSQRAINTENFALVTAKPALRAPGSGSSKIDNMPFNFLFRHKDQPGFTLPAIASRETRPLPRRISANLDVQVRAADQSVGSIQRRRRKIPVESSLASSSHSTSGSLPPMRPRPLSHRALLQATWSRVVETAGAAPVTIIDDFDEDSTPVDDITTFTYIESDYIFSSDVPQPDVNFMQSCGCTLGCNAPLCSCQDDSSLQDDDDDSKSFAYDSKGLFAFRDNMRSYVIECNKKCSCDDRCPSRVAQKPRKFPVEIFRTERCGWGVRSTVALPKGSVLGVYTGKIITRAEGSAYEGKRGTYIFNLDFFLQRTGSKYSVDAYECGNWTRFINHSCNPVCNIYPVIWDSVPSMHQPKLAFVANTDIPARAEISIDYNPKVRKGKGKAKVIRGTPDCMCGSEDCRGFIYDY